MKTLDPASLVFIDESGFSTKMTRLRGRSQRGKPCIGSVPHGHWQNNTFIAGLRHDRIVAPMLIPGPMDGDAFVVWVERALAPTLDKGDIVICDKSLPEGATFTRTPKPARPSRREEPNCASSLPTLRTSIQSKCCSQRSRPSREVPLQGASTPSALLSATSSVSSPKQSVPTTCATPGMTQPDRR